MLLRLSMAVANIISNLSKICNYRAKKTICSSQLFYLDKSILFHKINLFSNESGKSQTFPIESKIQDILRKNFPSAEYIEVRDVSGGCGAMFEISVIAEEFKGLTMVKQHRLVNEALKEEIKDMHGLRIHTALPSSPS